MRIISKRFQSSNIAIPRIIALSLLLMGVLVLAGLARSAMAVATVLAPNDVVIVSANSDTSYLANACTNDPQSNGIDLLLRRDIGSGTVIKITDNAWSGTALTTTEGRITYTAPTDLSAGTIIRYTDCIVQTAGSPWTTAGGFDPAVTGDTLLVYQGTEAAPSFIYGFGYRSTSWTTGTPTTNTSRVPAALSGASPTAYNTMASTTARNYQYTTAGNYGIYSATFLNSLKTFTNWNNSGAAAAGTQYGPSPVPFDAVRPTFNAAVRQTPAAATTSASTITFRITTSEPVQALASNAFTVLTTGTVVYGTVTATAVNSSTYDVTVTGLTGAGTIQLNTFVAAQLLDIQGNPATVTTFTSQAYTIDQVAPVVTVNPLATNQTQPALSGTIDDSSATVMVTVNGNTYTATVTGSAWTVAAGVITPALGDGIYAVTATATDLAGNSGIDATTNELSIDTVRPSVVINTSISQANPTNVDSISYTVVFSEPITPSSFTASDVTLSGTSGTVTGFTQVNSTTWTLVVTGTTSGQTVVATIPVNVVTDLVGNTNQASTSTDNSALYDATLPQVFAINIDVNSAGTDMEHPVITFTTVDNESGMDYYSISVDGSPFTVQNSGYQPTLAPAASHTVTVRAYDHAGNIRELTITYPPSVSIIAPTVLSNTPISDTSIAIGGPAGLVINSITITGGTGFNCGTFPQTVPFNCTGGTIATTGTLTVTALTASGVSVSNAQAYIIDTVLPVVTVTSLITATQSPSLSGTIDDTTATISVVVAGVTYAAVNNGDGTWTLAAGTISPALADGTYDVAVTATDTAGNVAADATTNELQINTTAPTGTINALSTTTTSPQLTGTVSSTTATISVVVAGVTYAAVNNGDGTWTLAAGTISPALSIGTFDVSVTFADNLGNTSSDTTSNELIISAVVTPTDPTTPSAPATGRVSTNIGYTLLAAVITTLLASSIVLTRKRR